MGAGRFTTRWGYHFTTRWGRRASGSTTEAELVNRLRALPVPAPEAHFKSELRAQLVAITARVVAESPAAEAAGDKPVAARASSRALRTLRRPALALAGASTVLVLLLGMAVWMAGGALPGQSLYGVKRASENVQLSMAGTDTAKGQAYLQLAGNRVHEVAELLSQPSAMLAGGGAHAGGGRINAHTASLVTDTLTSADDDSVNGIQLLSRAAVAQLSKEPLTKLSDWLPDQRRLLAQVRDRIPAGALRTRVQASTLLLQRIAARTAQLSRTMGCPCLAQAVADELGPVPCNRCGPVPNPTPGAGGSSSSLLVPNPGLGSSGASGSGPGLSLPPLGGTSGSSGSGHAGAPPATGPSTRPGLPATLPVTESAPLPSNSPPAATGTSGPPALGTPLSVPPLPSVTVPGAVGSAPLPGRLPSSLPVTLPVPLPSISFP